MSLVLQGGPMAAWARDTWDGDRSRDLSEAWRLWLSATAVDEALRPWLGTGAVGLHLADVRLATRDDAALRGPALHVRCRAGSDPLSLLLDFASALDAVERVLGGGHAGGARPLSPAECGLLGYGLARLFSAPGADLTLDHVDNDHAPGARADGQVLVAGELTGGFGTLPLRALLSPALAARLAPLTLRACLVDVPARGALEGLHAGDVLVGDTFLLTPTTRGLVGPLRLEALGMRVAARLEGGDVWVMPGVEPVRTGELRIVLTERSVDLWTWAAIRAGRAAAFQGLSPGPVTLEHDGRPLGAGELVLHHGALGVRITESGSAGSQAPRPA